METHYEISCFHSFGTHVFFSLAQAESVVFPGASWQVNVNYGPGAMIIEDTPIRQPMPDKSTTTGLQVNRFADRLLFTNMPKHGGLKRVCGEDVQVVDVPGVDLGHVDQDALSAWKGEFVSHGVRQTTVVYERPGSGEFVGTHTLRDPGSGTIIKSKFVITPASPIPKPPQGDDDDGDDPMASTPAPLGYDAVAEKLASEFGEDPVYMKKFMFHSVTDSHALLMKIWLDENGRALPAIREIKNPCDPRYGQLVPAKNLYEFKIVRYEDSQAQKYYSVQTRVMDIETGKIIDSYSPGLLGTSFDLDAEVSESYDGLNFDINEPRDFSFD